MGSFFYFCRKLEIMIEKIKKDKSLEPYFLEYIRLTLAIRDKPAEISINADKEIKTEFLKITFDFNEAVENLLQKLNEKYGLSKEIENDESPINKVLIEVCTYYVNRK